MSPENGGIKVTRSYDNTHNPLTLKLCCFFHKAVTVALDLDTVTRGDMNSLSPRSLCA